MVQNSRQNLDTEMEDLIEELLEQGLVSPTAEERAQRLRSHGHTGMALEVVVSDCKQRDENTGLYVDFAD